MKKHILLIIFSSFLMLLLATASTVTHAVSPSDWNAGKIIDDSIYYDGNSMSVEDIQNFLNSKVSNCDTYGQQRNATNPNLTNAQYAASVGWPGPPYICLKDYHQVPRSDVIVDNYQGSIPSGTKSAAQIIKDASVSFGVNPKVILVTLHKESLNLIYDTWPLQYQYKNSMGYACPDTAPCDPIYAGFYNQVNNAARQFKLYRDNASQYRYKPLATNSIYYNPNYSCGASNVYIENYATAGLYNYTPYQPNSAALNNLYGTGDNCSAYGNRNFWRIYNDWFGSTSDPFGNASTQLSRSLTITPSTPIQNKTYTAEFSIRNTSSNPVQIGSPFVVVRGPQGQNLDIPADNNVTIPANGTYTYSKNWSSPYEGQHNFSIALYKPGFGFSFASPATVDSSVVRTKTLDILPNPRVTSSLSISPAQPVKNQPYSATFSIRNDSDNAVDIGYPFVIVRGPQGQNLDVGIGDRVTIAPNSTYTYSKQWHSPYTGQHSLTLATYIPSKGILTNFPSPASGVNTTATMNVLDNPLLTQSLQINPSAPSQNQTYNATFKVTNSSSNPVSIGSLFVVVRGPQGQNLDIPADNNVTIPANGTYTYSKNWSSPYEGQHNFSVVTYRSDIGFSFTTPSVADNSIIRQKTINFLPNPRVTSSLSISPAQPVKNQPYSATFSIRNDSDNAVDIGYPFVIVRGPQGQNLDVGIGDRVTIAPNSTYTYSKQWHSPYTGQHSLTLATYIPSKGILTNFPSPASGVNTTATMNVTQ